MDGDPKARFINPPNSLKKAVVRSDPARVDRKLIEQAEAALSALQDDFPNWAAEYITEMRAALEKAKADPFVSAHRLDLIFTRAMDLKGMAGSYGYPMLTEMGDLLKRYTDGREGVSPRDLMIVEAHIDAMHDVLRDRISGDGGDTGRAVVANLTKLATAR